MTFPDSCGNLENGALLGMMGVTCKVFITFENILHCKIISTTQNSQSVKFDCS